MMMMILRISADNTINKQEKQPVNR